MEAFGACRALDDFEAQSLGSCGAGGDLALVAGIGEQQPEPGETSANPSTGQGQAVPVLDIGGVNDQAQWQAQRVGEQMALAAVHLLAGIEAVEFATLAWVDWFNHRRLLEPIGFVPPAEAEAAFYDTLEKTPLAA